MFRPCSTTAGILLILAFTACQSAKIGKTEFDDGIYSYSFERVTEAVQTESLYLGSGMQYSYRVAKTSSGNAIIMEENRFSLPEFYGKGEILEIGKDGKISSPTNETVRGNATTDGRISWTGTFTEHGQAVQITEYGLLLEEFRNRLSPSSMNGKYSVKLGGMYGDFDFTLVDGVATGENGIFCVNSDGEWRSRMSMKVIQSISGVSGANTMADVTTYGKIEPDGSVSYQMISGVNGVLSGADSRTTSFSGARISTSVENAQKNSAEDGTLVPERLESDRNAPKWFSRDVSEKNGKIAVCARQSANDRSTARKIAISTALAEISSVRALRVKSEISIDSEDSAAKDGRTALHELIETESLSDVQFSVENEFFDEKTGNFYVRVSEK